VIETPAAAAENPADCTVQASEHHMSTISGKAAEQSSSPIQQDLLPVDQNNINNGPNGAEAAQGAALSQKQHTCCTRLL
jgi:hypothetical protein